VAHFSPSQVFMDIDGIAPGVDFVDAIDQAVSSCDVFLVVIGRSWATIADDEGERRLDNPEDFIRLEIKTALDHDVRLIPVVVQHAAMPRSDQLPEDIVRLVRHNALELSDLRWDFDVNRLIDAIETPTGKAPALATAERPTVLRSEEDVLADLVVVSGPMAGARYGLAPGEYVVGRSSQCDISLSDPVLSRFHFRLFVEPGDVAIADMGATNGTRIDGETLLPGVRRSVWPGQLVRAGRCEIRFEPRSSASSPTPSFMRPPSPPPPMP